MASLLGKHSDIVLSTPKEPAYFTIHHARGLEWYRERFSAEGPVLLDATTWYSVGPTDLFPLTQGEAGRENRYSDVPRRIYEVSPDARFIYMLRDPIARLYSTYCFYSLAEGHSETFRQAIERNPVFLRGSDYVGQLRGYLEFFSLSRFHFILFEDFIRDPREELERVFSFLGLPSQPIALEGRRKNRNDAFLYNRMGSALTRLLGSREPVDRLRQGLKKLGPTGWARALDACLRREPPEMSPEDRDYVAAIFNPRNASLAKQTGLDLSQWRS